MADANLNELFVSLILGLQSSAWMHLGKVIHPATGKIERQLDEAKATIDLLGVLEEKTRGNLHAEEERLLTRVLFELRMNYVEEIGQKAAGPREPGDAPPRPEPSSKESGATPGEPSAPGSAPS